MKDLKAQYLSIYRLLCFLLAVMIPLFGLAFSYGNPDALSPPFFKEILAPTGILLIIASYKVDWVKKNMQKIMIGLYVVVIYWQLLVLGMNKFNPNNILGFLVIVFGITVGFENKKLFIWFISCLFVLITSFVLINEVEGISRLIFIITMFSTLLMAFLIHDRKFRAEATVLEFTNQITEKNKEITDSIIYGKRIQEAILPNKGHVRKFFPESFVVYIPKDIVAGDFYWMEHINDHVLFAVADCTGHGVPGALVSVVCNNALNRAVREYNLTNPGEILDKTTDLVIETFIQSDDTMRDGMDIALCSYNLKTKELCYSGANNPLYIVRGSELQEIRPDKQPVGKYAERSDFSLQNVPIEQGDSIYLFTDGFADQFGGIKGKKFKYKAFKDLILNVSNESVKIQKDKIERVFEKWKGDIEQVDDVCIIGIRF